MNQTDLDLWCDLRAATDTVARGPTRAKSHDVQILLDQTPMALRPLRRSGAPGTH